MSNIMLVELINHYHNSLAHDNSSSSGSSSSNSSSTSNILAK